jgi:hypothetical protein
LGFWVDVLTVFAVLMATVCMVASPLSLLLNGRTVVVQTTTPWPRPRLRGSNCKGIRAFIVTPSVGHSSVITRIANLVFAVLATSLLVVVARRVRNFPFE